MPTGTRKLGKPTDQRMAMLRQQVTDFLDKGQMKTTITRAKEIRPIAEKMITLGKKNTLASRRSALSFITREDVVSKIFSDIAPKYEARQGGYCRIIRIGPRRGDAAEMAVIELVEEEIASKPAKAAPAAPVRTASKKPAAKADAEVEAIEAATALETELETVAGADVQIEAEAPAEVAPEAEVETAPEADAPAPAEEEPKADA